MADKNIYWSKTLLTGGTAPALDSIDGTDLQDGEVAHVWISGALYIYLLDVDSAAAEASPTIISPDTNAGNKRWILQGVRTINVGSDADGDMYYRASSVLARLAKGAANLKMFMNAGATAPEWAGGIYKGTISYDISTTGDATITGIPFKPSLIFFLANIDNHYSFSTGFAFDTAMTCLWANSSSTFAPGAYAWAINCAGGDAYISAIVMTADGFTYTKAKSSSPTGTGIVNYFALR